MLFRVLFNMFVAVSMLNMADIFVFAANPALQCNGYPDSMDLAPDGFYYFFAGPYLYTIHKATQATTTARLITTEFAEVEYPVVAAFSTGPTDGRMFIIDSSKKPVKMFKMNVGASTPRKAERIGLLKDFFPDADTSIPQPLKAAISLIGPPVVFFLGGSVKQASGKRAAKYSFAKGPTTFTLENLGATTLDKPFWQGEVRAGTMYYSPNSRATTYYVFSSDAAVQVSGLLDITGGPTSVTGVRAQWLPETLHKACEGLAPTTLAPVPTVVTTTPITTLSTTTSTSTTTTSTTTPTTTTRTTPSTTPSTTTNPTTTTSSTTPTTSTTTPTTTTSTTTSTTSTTTPTTTPTTSTTTPTTTTSTTSTTTSTTTTSTTTPTTTTTASTTTPTTSTTPSTTTSTTTPTTSTTSPTTTTSTTTSTSTTPTTTSSITTPTTTTATSTLAITTSTTTSASPTTTSSTTPKPEPSPITVPVVTPDFPLLHPSCRTAPAEEEDCDDTDTDTDGDDDDFDQDLKPPVETAQVWGWRIEDANAAGTSESWTIPDTSSDVEECFRRCSDLHVNCGVVSYDTDTEKCLGFSRQAKLRFSRSFTGTIFARTPKKMCPMSNGLAQYHAYEDIEPTPEHVGTIEICLAICVVTPRCNYAIYSGVQQRCYLHARTELKDADIRRDSVPWKYSVLVAM